MSVRHLAGDCRAILPTLPAESVHCVVCSPPYYGLRDYGVAGQIGLEATPEAYVAELVGVFREVRRVLRRDGTAWINLGDSYAAGGTAGRPSDKSTLSRHGADGRSPYLDQFGNGASRKPALGLKPKDLIGIPWMVAFALRADGWYLRSDIIWSKPNPMPESVTDRPTKAHEYLFLLSRSARYFYDAEAIAEPGTARETFFPSTPQLKALAAIGSRNDGNRANLEPALTRNRRSVWTVATQPFSEAHFATFPPALIEPCIKAGVPEKCCARCGAPWVRQTAPSERYAKYLGKGFNDHTGDLTAGMMQNRGVNRQNRMLAEGITGRELITLGFSPSCACDAGTVPGTVLDCFGGAGTTGLVADRLQRNAILIELSDAYAGMAQTRIADDRGPLLALMEGP